MTVYRRRSDTLTLEPAERVNILERLVDDQPWMRDGLCAQTDPEAFYPEKGGSTREAKAICLRCEVRIQCLDYALSTQERFGIWGGYSERERRKLKKSGITPAAAPIQPAKPRGRAPRSGATS